VREQLQEHIARLRKQLPDAAASWSRVENIHLTLKFFGNVALDQIPLISAVAARAVAEFSTFPIVIGTTGVFPRPSRAQVLWIGVSDPSGKLSALQERLENECAAEGFPKENRAYRPHLTIARLRKPEDARRLADAHLQMHFPTIDVQLYELIVFRSELSPKGSKYTAISKHPIRK
jgi:2'-5' RNA ligase